MSSKFRCRPNSAALKPAILGLLTAFAITMLFIAVFALLFVIIKEIAESAIVPIALISAVIGCFAGAYICAVRAREGAVIYGVAIGLAMFVTIWIIGVFSSNSIFGTETIIKFIVLVSAGFAGGCMGQKRRIRK